MNFSLPRSSKNVLAVLPNRLASQELPPPNYFKRAALYIAIIRRRCWVVSPTQGKIYKPFFPK